MNTKANTKMYFLKWVLTFSLGIVVGIYVSIKNNENLTGTITVDSGSKTDSQETSTYDLESTADTSVETETNVTALQKDIVRLKTIVKNQEAAIEQKEAELAEAQSNLKLAQGEELSSIEERNALENTPEERERLTAEFYQVMKMDELITSSIEQALKGSFKSPEDQEKFEEIFNNHFSWDKLKPGFHKVYSEVFTSQELHDIIRFYHTPIGRKLIEKQPELTRKTTEQMMGVMQGSMQAFKEEMKAANISKGEKGTSREEKM